jgi:hypothetical protein
MGGKLMGMRDLLVDMYCALSGEPRGQLWATIHRLVGAETGKAICQRFGVEETMPAQKESARSFELFKYRTWKWTAVVVLTWKEQEDLAQRTYRTALMMIGLWCSQQAKGGTRPAPVHRAEEGAAPGTTPRVAPGEKVALALVVRSTRLGDLPTVSESIPLERVIDLIANAVYFRCSLPPEADAREKELELCGAPDPRLGSPHEHDVYLRLEIEGAGDLVDARSPFGLRNRLRDQPPRAVHLARRARLGCPPDALHDFHSI